MSGDLPADSESIVPGKRLIRANRPTGFALRDRLKAQLNQLLWKSPLHRLRLKGRYPLKLLTVPEDPIKGDPDRGAAILRGSIYWQGTAQEVAACTFTEQNWSPSFARHMHSFAWLRDLAALNDRERVAPLAEQLMRTWLAAHSETVSDVAWRGDLAGARLLFWMAHAPLILSSPDIIYRSSVLSILARTARHLEQVAGHVANGVPRIEAWAGAVAANLLMPGGEARRSYSESGLKQALATGLFDDGGPICRSPEKLGYLIQTLAMLQKVYAARGERIDPWLAAALEEAVALYGALILGDGGLSSWQGGVPLAKADVDTLLRGAPVRTRPKRQSFDWGYQRLENGRTSLIMDAAPPPIGAASDTGCASTLGFEMSDGPYRLIVNCGGAGAGGAILSDALVQALRTSAAHSTLVVADSNSTALLPLGGLGAGVGQTEVEWQDSAAGGRVEASHDGYVRRFGMLHRRTLTLLPDGSELRGDDVLVPQRRVRNGVQFAIRFHLGVGVDASPTAVGNGALLRLPDGHMWQFRCQNGTLALEDSLWVDANGQMHPTQQLVISGDAPAGGATFNWVLKRAR
ncbi:MAG: heparinase II/III family protein [Alphaproteobacteria bacterium]|nr:heparinase II/III family protein [Alphaproteobacteria bacterium]